MDAHVLTADGLNNVVRRGAQKLCNNRELVDMILSWKQWLSLQHLRKDAGCTPDIDFHIVFLPCEHDLGSAIIPGRDIACHLGVLNTGKAKVADFQITVLVDEDVARLKIAMNDTGRVDIF